MSNPQTHAQSTPRAKDAAPDRQPSSPRRPYTPPALTHYGLVTEITQKNPLSFLQDEIIAETSP